MFYHHQRMQTEKFTLTMTSLKDDPEEISKNGINHKKIPKGNKTDKSTTTTMLTLTALHTYSKIFLKPKKTIFIYILKKYSLTFVQHSSGQHKFTHRGKKIVKRFLFFFILFIINIYSV